MTTINVLRDGSPWKVTWAQEITNVSVDGSGNDSKISFFKKTGTTNKMTCEVTDDFVIDEASSSYPVDWEGTEFTLIGGVLHGTVPSASSTGHPVEINTNAAGTILTCLIDPDDSPPSQWTGQHG